MNEGRRSALGGRAARHPLLAEAVVCGVVTVALAAVGALAAWMASGRGVTLGGDQSTYIIQAQALLHATTQLGASARLDQMHHLLFPAPRPVIPETAPGVHGRISPFEPGMAALLAPFVVIGPLYHAAVAGMLLTSAAGLVLIHRLATRLTGIGTVGQALLGVMLFSPAVLVAVDQIYPDLPSGILLACALLEVALLERRGSTRPVHVAVFVLSAAFLPWLQVKNLAPAAVVVAAFVTVAWRARLRPRRVLGVAAASLTSWGLLLLYDDHYFGTLFGLHEPPVRLSSTGAEYILGLLFGRDQGLFVQVPFAVLGVLGLCLVLRRLPAAVVATVVALGSVLVLNGTYVVNPYGGGSFAGRFMWTLVPALVAWSAVVMRRWEGSGRRLLLPGAVIGAVWVYLAVPVLVGDHRYINVFAGASAWDPASIPGWWSGLDRVVPEFDAAGQVLGYPGAGIVFELALATLAVVAALSVVRPSRRRARVGAAALVVALLAVVAVEVSGPPLPRGAVTYRGVDVGSPRVVSTVPVASSPVVLQRVSPGAYRVTMGYRLTGTTASGALSLTCVPTGPGPSTHAGTGLVAGAGTAVVAIRCRVAAYLESQLTVGPATALHVDGLRLAKVSG